MGKIKVLHISPDGMLFGTERHILSIAKNANPEEFEHIISVPRKGSFTDELEKYDIQYVISGRMHAKGGALKGMLENKGIINLAKLIWSSKFDIVHTHLNTYGGFTAKLLGTAKVIHTRHGIFWTQDELDNISLLRRKFQKMKGKYFSKTIALSSSEMDTMVNYFNYNENDIEIIYNGVSVDEIEGKVDKNASKSSLFGTTDFIVGSVGRFERQKGFHLLVESAAKIIREVSNIKFVIIGRGSLKESIEEKIRALGLEKFFIILDYKTNVFDYIKNFDIMVSTSLWEGVPYVLLEAMALGKPIVAFTSKLSGVNEIVNPWITGCLITEDYTDNLSIIVKKLVMDKKLLADMGLKSKELVKEKFSELKMVLKTEELYRQVVSGN